MMKFLSVKTHTIIGLIVGIVLLFTPGILNFNDNSATAVAQVVGIFILLSELITTSQFSPLKLVPMRVHIVIDYITGVFLAVSPWLFGFADAPATEWVPHLIVGIIVIGYALVTNPALNTTTEKTAIVR